MLGEFIAITALILVTCFLAFTLWRLSRPPVGPKTFRGFDSTFGSSGFEPRIATIETQLAKLEQAQRSLSLEWIDAYERLRKLAARIDRSRGWEEARAAKDETAIEPNSSETPPAPRASSFPSRHSLLIRKAGE